eukprot:524378-Hanusia_phi.AAC.10
MFQASDGRSISLSKGCAVIVADGDERKGERRRCAGVGWKGMTGSSGSINSPRRLSKSIKELIEETDAVIAGSKKPLYAHRKSNSSADKAEATEEEKNELLQKVMKKIQEKADKSKDTVEDSSFQELIDKSPLALLLPKPPQEEMQSATVDEKATEQASRPVGLQAKLKGIVQGVRERAGSEEKESMI